ncbi:MAG: hypothetical protein ICV87_08630, partial [Gemmatimonadetes bacterium]|nr:hypothetical protein [Gemmatimonadota bacterium]
MPPAISHRLPRTLAALLCAAAGACTDLPSAPESFVREAGGATWVAVVEPAGLPTARTWLATLPSDAPQAGMAWATLEEASRVLKTGNVEGALALEDRAAREITFA